jgi:hypothetical protein
MEERVSLYNIIIFWLMELMEFFLMRHVESQVVRIESRARAKAWETSSQDGRCCDNDVTVQLLVLVQYQSLGSFLPTQVCVHLGEIHVFLLLSAI